VHALPEDPREGLPLATATPDAWVLAVLSDVSRTLGDHAHCELKAASTALRLMGRYSDDALLLDDLSALAREEMRHFERVRGVISERGQRLPPVGPDTYVKELRRRAQRGLSASLVALDTLVICAFVEARSCERFRILARALPDASLRAFYAELALAEARHHEIFLEHAARRSGREATEARTREIAAIEGELILSLKVGPRIH
jgi:tRNA 2-(methylsulfanyl)-N6-isopentenyladenosine37 hydroxylase